MAKINELTTPQFQFTEQPEKPATPDAGVVKVYAKSDGKMYFQDDAGTEYQMGMSDTDTDEKVKASSADVASGYLDAKVKNSVEVNGDKLQLKGDAETPGNSKYYGTDGGGTRGFYDIPGNSASALVVENRTSDPESPVVGRVWLRTDL